MSQVETQTLRHRVNDHALDAIFRNARTHNTWLDKPVSEETIREIYDLMKWGPTSANSMPARFLFLRTEAAKERLRPALAPGNVEKTMAAPVTVIVGYDVRFYEKLPKLAPHNPAFRDLLAMNAELADATAKRNSTLQGGYFIIAARALGLDCGPMSGFDNAKVDAEFFGAGAEGGGTPKEHVLGTVKSNFLCNLGYGDPASVRARTPRLEFAEACRVL
ncbi:MAG TPA: malonic semialdehyde reductase [Terriglobales bacterium]|nr:malonic semialdehyde reductase [Terriglobales bacterium]